MVGWRCVMRQYQGLTDRCRVGEITEKSKYGLIFISISVTYLVHGNECQLKQIV